MVQKWLATVSVLAVLAAGPAKADVIYTFFDSASPSTVDLDFSVADQLSPANPTEPLLSTSGVFASDFVGGTGVYSQRPRRPANPGQNSLDSLALLPSNLVVYRRQGADRPHLVVLSHLAAGLLQQISQSQHPEK